MRFIHALTASRIPTVVSMMNAAAQRWEQIYVQAPLCGIAPDFGTTGPIPIGSALYGTPPPSSGPCGLVVFSTTWTGVPCASGYIVQHVYGNSNNTFACGIPILITTKLYFWEAISVTCSTATKLPVYNPACGPANPGTWRDQFIFWARNIGSYDAFGFSKFYSTLPPAAWRCGADVHANAATLSTDGPLPGWSNSGQAKHIQANWDCCCSSPYLNVTHSP